MGWFDYPIDYVLMMVRDPDEVAWSVLVAPDDRYAIARGPELLPQRWERGELGACFAALHRLTCRDA